MALTLCLSRRAGVTAFQSRHLPLALVQRNPRKLQKRFYPNIMMTPEEEKQLTELKENMKKDVGVTDYSDLSAARQWWYRRLGVATGIVAGSIALSAVLAPTTLGWISSTAYGPETWDLGILVLIGSIGVMTGSELTKLIADHGLLFSIPVQCAFASLIGLPIWGVYNAFPEAAPRYTIFAVLCYLVAQASCYYSVKYSKTRDLITNFAPPAVMLSMTALVVPGPLCTEELFILPLFYYWTWKMSQRNLKLAQHGPNLEYLDTRLPAAVGLNLLSPLLLIAFGVAYYWWRKRNEERLGKVSQFFRNVVGGFTIDPTRK